MEASGYGKYLGAVSIRVHKRAVSQTEFQMCAWYFDNCIVKLRKICKKIVLPLLFTLKLILCPDIFMTNPFVHFFKTIFILFLTLLRSSYFSGSFHSINVEGGRCFKIIHTFPFAVDFLSKVDFLSLRSSLII